MPDHSVPVSKPAVEYVSATERADYLYRLDRIIARLWADARFAAQRRAIARTRAALRQWRDTGDPSFGEEYCVAVATVVGHDGRFSIHDTNRRALHGARLPTAWVDDILVHAGVSRDAATAAEDWRNRLLLAHLLLWPDEIHAAAQIPEPFPWPWVMQTAEEGGMLVGRVVVVPSVDITDPLRRAANKVQTDLDRPFRHEPPAPRGTSTHAKQRTADSKAARLRVGALANQLYANYKPDGILNHPDFLAALREANMGSWTRRRDGEREWCPAIRSDTAVRGLINEYRTAHGLPPLTRGRPPRH